MQTSQSGGFFVGKNMVEKTLPYRGKTTTFNEDPTGFMGSRSNWSDKKPTRHERNGNHTLQTTQVIFEAPNPKLGKIEQQLRNLEQRRSRGIINRHDYTTTKRDLQRQLRELTS